MIEQSGWDSGLDRVDGIFHKNREFLTEICKIAKELIFKNCPCYYEYEKLFGNHSTPNPPTLIELQQPIRHYGQIVNDIELGGYNKDFHERKSLLPDSEGLNNQNGEEDERQDNKDKFDSSSLHSILLQIARNN